MALTVDYRTLVAFLLALARTLAWMMVVPPFANRQTIPPLASIATAMGLAFLLGPLIPASQIPSSAAGLIGGVIIQVISGVALGFVVYLLLTTLTSAGASVDLMGGLNLPPSIDPLSLGQTPMLGQFYEQLAVVLLFASGGYLVILQGFAASFATPAFTLASLSRVAQVVVIDLSTYFVSALEIAAPMLAVLFATQIMLAVLSKAAPQVNVWILGMPLQIFLAIVLVGIGITGVPAELTNLIARALGDTAHLFGGG